MFVNAREDRPRWASIAINVRTALTAGALTLLFGLGAVSVLIQPPTTGTSEIGLSARPLDHMMSHNRCSYTGFGTEVIPSKAIVEDPSGRTRLVSFDVGWKVFTGKRDGQLVAVCLGPRPDHRSTHA
ncbi:MAG: hypothetical protein FWE71_08595 [Nocardioidaceae bacterium]|nr:hypothetical protein [Nocardioidaceae bacterium]MCL2612931.1 hypothetical protein [Nocardioidaceae bacterium]